MPLGIFGGTFNPVHFGHLRAAVELRSILKLDEIRMIPCRLPAHRKEPGVSSSHRMAMLECGIGKTDGLIADSRELDRDGYSYTVDTLHSFVKEFSQRDIILIIGVDAFSGFERWHKWQDILDLCNIAVMNRPNSHLSASAKKLLVEREVSSFEQFQGAVGKIFECNPTYLDISSTKIRSILSKGNEANYLVPLSVQKYIEKHRLYLPTAQSKIYNISKRND